MSGALALLAAVNMLRAANGVPAVQPDDYLRAVAAVRALQASVQFTHHSPDGSLIVLTMLPPGIWVGENLARAQDAEQAETALEGSPPHRAIMLDGHYSRVGTGELCAANGCTYAEVFTS